jgi:hypothetical protein
VVFRLGAALDSRLWVADGGVRGREFDPETFLSVISTSRPPNMTYATYKELKLSRSAWE